LFLKAAINNADTVPAFEENKYILETMTYNHVEKVVLLIGCSSG
jgi:hypothetical protein